MEIKRNACFTRSVQPFLVYFYVAYLMLNLVVSLRIIPAKLQVHSHSFKAYNYRQLCNTQRFQSSILYSSKADSPSPKVKRVGRIMSLLTRNKTDSATQSDVIESSVEKKVRVSKTKAVLTDEVSTKRKTSESRDVKTTASNTDQQILLDSPEIQHQEILIDEENVKYIDPVLTESVTGMEFNSLDISANTKKAIADIMKYK